DQIQNLEIDRNGRVMPRLNDLDPLENTLLSVLYPGVKVASVNVPVEPLDEYEESKVENALAKLVWRGIHYKLVGASGSAKKGYYYVKLLTWEFASATVANMTDAQVEKCR